MSTQSHRKCGRSSPAAFVLICVVALAAACTTPSHRPLTEAVAPVAPLSALTYDGDQSALVALNREIAGAGNDSAKLTAIADRLITSLRAPDATFAARQAICQRLGMFPAAILLNRDSRTLFAAMLVDEKQVNLARLALEQVPGEAIDSLFLGALAKATGSARLALIQSVGNRRIAGAVSALTPFLTGQGASSDAAESAAAAKALGQIGTLDALAALRRAPEFTSPVIVEATLFAAHQIGGAEAVRAFQDILDHPRAPANLRAAALHGLILADTASAPARIVAVLDRNDPIFRPVVIEAIAALPGSAVVAELSRQLASWDAPTQTAVVAALGRKGDAAAVPAIRTATKHADPEVRAAAIVALGELPGAPDTATLLGQIVSTGTAEDAKLARQSLARLNGPGVAETILDGAANAEPSLRAAFLEQLSLRGMNASVPLLLGNRRDPNPTIRAASLNSLVELGSASDQAALLDWATTAEDPTEQSRAIRALAAVSLRIPDATERTRPVIAALDQASPAVAVRLIPVLPRLGGSTALECTVRLAVRDDPTIANAALASLARWPDGAGLSSLIDVAVKAPSAATRSAALQAAIRHLLGHHELRSPEVFADVARLLDTTTDTQARSRLVFLLGRCKEDAALVLTEKLQHDPALAAEARDAAAVIRSNRAGPPSLSASQGASYLPRMIDGNIKTRWAAPVEPGQWIQLDFKLSRPLRQLVLDSGALLDDYPEHVEVFVTDDASNPGAPVASAPGQGGKTVIDFPAGTHGRYLIVRNTAAREGGWWSVNELSVD